MGPLIILGTPGLNWQLLFRCGRNGSWHPRQNCSHYLFVHLFINSLISVLSSELIRYLPRLIGASKITNFLKEEL